MSRGEAGRSAELDASDREGIAQLREALRSAGYEPGRMREMLHAEGENLTPRASDVPVVLRLLPAGDRLADLLRLFLLKVELDPARAAAALAPLALDRAERLGIVERAPSAIRARVRILPAGDLLFACDLQLESDPDLPPDHVMGVSSSSIFLASLTVREPVRDVLDVGCGGGIQSVLAGQHARRVVACDINPRALAFTAFNAALNGVTNVECREGSFFEPVAGAKFDLIVANPPFVVSPDSAFVFRDSGMRGDDVSRSVLTGAIDHLAEGGLAFVLVSWGIPPDASWDAPLRSWVFGLECDAWFVQHASATGLGYAATWNEPLLRATDPGAYDAALDRWTRYYDELGYAAIGYGAAIVRKRSGASSHWVRADDIRGQRTPASGQQVARLIAAQDFLATKSDDEVLATAFRAADDLRVDQSLRLTDGAFVVEAAALRVERGIRYESEIDAFTADLLQRFDGRTPLRDCAAGAASRFATGGVTADEFVRESVGVVRRLLALGLVRLNGA